MEVAQPKVSSILREQEAFRMRFVIGANPWNFVAKGLLHGRQRTIQIIDNVLDILDAH
jgi:hypothetical protein